MPGRVVEVLSRGTGLSRERGFMAIHQPEKETAKIPLSDIAVLIVGSGVNLSTNLLLALHEQGAMVVVSGSNFHPASVFWPMGEHTFHCKRLDLQINASLPLQKRIWQKIVQRKISSQAEVLQALHDKDNGLKAFATRVRSGDPDNLEAQAARRYWQTLMGTDFRRRTDPTETTDPNTLLNYGYAILRASMARAISASGLHPALGVHHKNQSNVFRLVDDLMEPYRPFVDYKVAQWRKHDEKPELTPETKRQLAAILDIDLCNHAGENSPLSVTMLQVAQSFCTSLEQGTPTLSYPKSILPSTRLL